MADRASGTITIDADAATVLDVIRDVEAYPEWTAGISRVEVLEPGAEGPRKVTFSMSASGVTDDYTLVYDWQADGVEWSLAEPTKLQKAQQGSYRLSGDGSRTEVTYLLTMDVKIPMIGLMRRKAEKMIIDSALKELKKRVESLG